MIAELKVVEGVVSARKKRVSYSELDRREVVLAQARSHPARRRRSCCGMRCARNEAQKSCLIFFVPARIQNQIPPPESKTRFTLT